LLGGHLLAKGVIPTPTAAPLILGLFLISAASAECGSFHVGHSEEVGLKN
jgi:hypothetical protein